MNGDTSDRLTTAERRLVLGLGSAALLTLAVALILLWTTGSAVWTLLVGGLATLLAIQAGAPLRARRTRSKLTA